MQDREHIEPTKDPGRAARGSIRAYETIEAALRESIRDGALQPGVVLLEGRIAAIFGSSRTPVRQALDRLLSEGVVSRFDGRGLIVGNGAAAINRRPLGTVDIAAPADGSVKQWAWETIYHEVEHELIRASVLGCYRVNEMELARHYGIGRTVGRDVLVRIQATGILAKDRQAHWITVPLDDRRLRDLYALRELLEPAALLAATQHIPAAEIAAMRSRLRAAVKLYPDVSPKLLDQLEHDLHVSCPAYAGNRELLAALARARCIIISSKHILHHAARLPPRDPFLREHGRVLAALARRDGEAAAAALSAHLRSAREKVSRRLKQFRKQQTLSAIGYIGPRKPFAPDDDGTLL